jgi:hypothetical protein|tara:strand:+ start:45 stop:248 length:204 start_codon:yes stop_codon:yes gene_type:complete
MAKKNINELNMASRFIGDFFDGLQRGTADRIIKKAADKGLPKEFTDRMEKIRKEKADIDALLKRYSK